MRHLRLLIACAAALVIVGVVVFERLPSSGGPAAADTPSTPNTPIPIVVPPSPGNVDRYLKAIQTAGDDGLRVWIEADLVKRWRAGAESFQQGIDVIAREAQNSAVVGIKIADELGYHDGLTSASQIDDFLDASATALRAAAPGKRILVDIVVPELGCLPDYQPAIAAATACTTTQERNYPQLTLSAFDGYLQRHDVDVVDVSTYLQSDSTYATWGIATNTAETAAWQNIAARGWASLVTVNARKALAHAGTYGGTAADADAALHTYADIPIQAGGHAVDIWAWRQFYQGQIYRLMDAGPTDNSLWEAILARRRAGDQLFTHFSPTSVESTLDSDMKMLATAFTDVFVAAGTG